MITERRKPLQPIHKPQAPQAAVGLWDGCDQLTLLIRHLCEIRLPDLDCDTVLDNNRGDERELYDQIVQWINDARANNASHHMDNIFDRFAVIDSRKNAAPIGTLMFKAIGIAASNGEFHELDPSPKATLKPKIPPPWRGVNTGASTARGSRGPAPPNKEDFPLPSRTKAPWQKTPKPHASKIGKAPLAPPMTPPPGRPSTTGRPNEELASQMADIAIPLMSEVKEEDLKREEELNEELKEAHAPASSGRPSVMPPRRRGQSNASADPEDKSDFWGNLPRYCQDKREVAICRAKYMTILCRIYMNWMNQRGPACRYAGECHFIHSDVDNEQAIIAESNHVRDRVFALMEASGYRIPHNIGPQSRGHPGHARHRTRSPNARLGNLRRSRSRSRSGFAQWLA